jgi:hypothetical protein
MKRSSLRPPLGVGVLTVLTVLVVLLLCSFSIMSLLSANADARLTQMAKIAVTDYYDMDSQAEQKVAEIEEAMRSGADWQQKLAEIGVSVTLAQDAAQLRFTIHKNNQALWVSLNQPLQSGRPHGLLTRTRWQRISEASQ